jgi:hypothetical protein
MDQFVTTVKLDNELYSQFKEINVRSHWLIYANFSQS